MQASRRVVRLGVVAEDRNLADACVAVIRACGARAGIGVELSSVETTSGCRAKRFGYLVEASAAGSDIVVAAADAAGEGHGRGRAISFRRKAQALEELVPLSVRHKALFAAAAPCAEAWLLADPQAFGEGIRSGIGVDFTFPSTWPLPRSEREAKAAIGDVVAFGTRGDMLPRNGFELCAEILGSAALEQSSNLSLRDFSHRLIGRLRGLTYPS